MAWTSQPFNSPVAGPRSRVKESVVRASAGDSSRKLWKGGGLFIKWLNLIH